MDTKTESLLDENSKVTIHMVASLDGFIEKKNGSIAWLHSEDKFDEGKTLNEEEINDFIEKIDCYIMGSRTYEKALELGWPYGEKPVYVVSSRKLNSEKPSVLFATGDLSDLVNSDLKTKYQNIWMVGGAALTKAFLQLDLADEIVLSIMPVLLGDGILFFDFIGKEIPLHLKEVSAYQDGMVELSYEIKKQDGTLKNS